MKFEHLKSEAKWREYQERKNDKFKAILVMILFFIIVAAIYFSGQVIK